jgi:hypothetical protein
MHTRSARLRRPRTGRAVLALAACLAVPMALAAVNLPVASADIGGGLPGITENGSDPMVTRCTFNNQNGYCMVTSQDIGHGGTAANPYPMNVTKGYFSTDGLNWQDRGAVFTEDKITQPTGFVPPGANHVWAPDLVRGPNNTYRLYVPDVADNSLSGSHISSRISMSTSNSPFGPFAVQGTVSFSEGGAVQYGSDPEVVNDSGSQYLFWATGDSDSCGEYWYSPMSSDGLTVSGRSTFAVQINGIPSFYGSCHRANSPFLYAADYPYMEGPAVFKTADLAPDLTGLPGPYLMVMPIKPANTPPECANAPEPNTPNSVLAYATAPSITGPYTYQRILMCGSSTEWTNQGYLAEVTASNGAKRMALYYHDGTPGSDGSPNRKVHAECLWYGGGTFAMATRTTTGFQNCMSGADSNSWALRTQKNHTEIVSADLDHGAVLSASRAAVDPWERFNVLTTGNGQVGPKTTGNFTVRLVALNNGKFVSAENAGGSPLVANRTTAGSWETFQLTNRSDGTASLTATVNSRGVATQSNGQLIANTPSGTAAENYVVLHL